MRFVCPRRTAVSILRDSIKSVSTTHSLRIILNSLNSNFNSQSAMILVDGDQPSSMLFPKPNAGAIPGFADELHARFFEDPLEVDEGLGPARRDIRAEFEAMERLPAQFGLGGRLFGRPVQ